MSTLASPSPPRAVAAAPETSLGVSRRKACVFAYSAGWISGLVVLWLEGRDAETRRHAAQAVLGFGLLTLLGAACLALEVLGILTSLTLFRIGLWAAQAVVLVGVVLWGWSLVRVAFGGSPRWPLIGARAERLAAVP
jgi:uncharacterized membrane protein